MSLIRIDVAAGSRSYPVLVGPDLAGRLKSHLDDLGFPAHRVVVSSPHVWRLHGDRAASALAGRTPVLVRDGERSKHLRTVSRIYDGLIAAAADRGSGIVAIGGGVIGDMAGFAAATYLRGIAVAHVPTTLLAQVDSAIGGKTGVNLPQGKNLVGAFHQPAAVLVDPSFLATLSGREFRAGLYEVLKYAMASSLSLFEHLQKNADTIARHRHAAALLPVIEQCCRIKAGIVTEDEREQGVRRVLNFGHTAGHAFEAVTRYARFRHGEAVAWGMLVACHLAHLRGRLDPGDRDAFGRLLFGVGTLPTIGDLRTSDVLDAIGRDKKVVEGRLNFVLPVGIGRVEIVQDVTTDELRAALVAAGCINS
jgi:3-dehydroquinate synthase